jgi:hypothetical protein
VDGDSKKEFEHVGHGDDAISLPPLAAATPCVTLVNLNPDR